MLASVLQPALQESLNITAGEWEDIEAATRNQALLKLWYLVWARKVTGSSSVKILCWQDPINTSFTQVCVIFQSFKHIPPPIKWDIENEFKGNQGHIRYSRSYGKTIFTTNKCDLIIHSTMGWFGASLDADITKANSEFPQDIVEFKYLYSKRHVIPQETGKNPDFLLLSNMTMMAYITRSPIVTTTRFRCNCVLEWTCTISVIFVCLPQKALLLRGFHWTLSGDIRITKLDSYMLISFHKYCFLH